MNGKKSLPAACLPVGRAGNLLSDYITPIIKKQKKVIFFDEFPWINSPRSGFLPAFENFWNIWASRQKNLVVVICGSATSWMIQKIVNYNSLFDDARYHIDIIRVLAGEKKGLTRGEIIQKCNLTSGGGTTQILAELTESGFITPYIPFDRTVKDNIYKLTDEYSAENIIPDFGDNLWR